MSKNQLHGAALVARAKSKRARGLKLTQREQDVLRKRGGRGVREGEFDYGTSPDSPAYVHKSEHKSEPKNPKQVAAGKRAAAAKKRKQEEAQKEVERKRAVRRAAAKKGKPAAKRKAAGQQKGATPMAAKKSPAKSAAKKPTKKPKKKSTAKGTLYQQALAKKRSGGKLTRRESGSLGAHAAKRNKNRKHTTTAATPKNRKHTTTAATPKKPATKKGAAKSYTRQVVIPRRSKGVTIRVKKNPIAGMEMFPAVAGFVVGSLLASLADRVAATHAVTGVSGASGAPGTTATAQMYTDAPAAGQMYNAEALNAPIWTNWKRGVAAAVSVVLPFGLASVSHSAGARSFWQLAGFGAMCPTVAKAVNDLVAQLTKGTLVGQRLYAPELAAQADVVTAKALTAAPTALPLPGALASSNYGQVSGLPRFAPRLPGRRVGLVEIQDPSQPTTITTTTTNAPPAGSTPSTPAAPTPPTTYTQTTYTQQATTPSIPQYQPPVTSVPSTGTVDSGCPCWMDPDPERT